MPPPTLRRWATIAALGVEAAFGSAIVVLPSPPLALHAVAGTVLLVLVSVALASAWGHRGEQPRPVPRLAAALVVLVGTGAVGAALATDRLPGTLFWLPGVFLLVLAGLLIDSLPSRRPRGARGTGAR